MNEAASLDDLTRELEELRASRARIATAADDELRRIERGLHDGVQQHLIALAVNLQLARERADSDPAALKAVLEEIAQDVRDALESVRALAHGVYPSLLIDRGLVEALRGAAATAGIPTRVEAEIADRYPPAVESAAYFCCLQALDAAGDVEAAQRALVRVRTEGEAMLFEVALEGDAEHALEARGSALTRMNDRLGAVDGRLRISSEPGRTTIAGTIPLGR